MRAPEAVVRAWMRFRGVPMETLTKAWWWRRCAGVPRQRTVAEIRHHRDLMGGGGNCFDLALWWMAELAEIGVPARPVGHDLETPHAHIAVVASADGAEYLCDLGDQWLQPILIDPTDSAFDPAWRDDFFPGARVRVEREGNTLCVHYLFPDGAGNRQTYHLGVVRAPDLERACVHSQRLLRKPLIEVVSRYPATGELGAWEFDRFRSFWRLPSGRRPEPGCDDLSAWVARIGDRTGMSRALVAEGLDVYGVSRGR